MKRVRFSEAHISMCASILGISSEKYKEQAASLLLERRRTDSSGVWKQRYKSVRTFLLGERSAQEPTRAMAIQILNELGVECDDRWLLSDGKNRPDVNTAIPQVTMPQIVVNKDEQRDLAKRFHGLYALYRTYGTNEAKLVRELFWIDDSFRLNHRSAMLNRKGSMYIGTTYKNALVIHSYLFRPITEFGFSQRLLSIAVTAAGSRRSFGGLIYRILRTTSFGDASDVVLLKVNDGAAIAEMRRMLTVAESTPAEEHEPFSLDKLRELGIEPRAFENHECMSPQEREINRFLRNEDDNPRRVSAIPPIDVDKLQLRELPKGNVETDATPNSDNSD